MLPIRIKYLHPIIIKKTAANILARSFLQVNVSLLYVQIYRNLRRNLKCAFENFFSSIPSGPGFSRWL